MNKLALIIFAWFAAGTIWLLSDQLTKGRLTRNSFMLYGLIAITFFNQSIIHCYILSTPSLYVVLGASRPTTMPGLPIEFNLGNLLLMAIPFGLLSLVVTIRRLDALHGSRWIAALVLVPFGNLLLYTFLSLQDSVTEWKMLEILKAGLIDKIGAALLSVTAWIILAVPITRFLTISLGQDAFPLLVTMQAFIFGAITSVVYGTSIRRTFLACQTNMLISAVLLPSLFTLSYVIESIFCQDAPLFWYLIFMSYGLVPILFVAFNGASLGYVIQALCQRTTKA
jgi:hypothetical protein